MTHEYVSLIATTCTSIYIAWRNTSQLAITVMKLLICMILLISQQIILILLKHFTLIWIDCKNQTLYVKRVQNVQVNGLCLQCYILKMISKLKQFDCIVSSYQMPLIKPNKLYLDFAYIKGEFKSNANNHENFINLEIHVDSHILIYLNVNYSDTQWKYMSSVCISEYKFTSHYYIYCCQIWRNS